ncbi:MAG: F0F1 ATP synthase subunit B [Planctomycetota bacterium]|nr:F0F1 ATP synthase subunit B [Planctomycetota bacterium]MDG2143494.1 F0F1 ATP synthase subunit B [Planctomycetota bacterium]
MQLTSFLASGGYDPLAPDTFGQALWTLIIFGLSVPFIWKIVLGPIVMALEERDGHAKEAILAAETAKEEAERVRAEVEVSLGEARAESAREMAEARERGEKRAAEIITAAEEKAKDLVVSAQAAIRSEQDKALSAIRSEVVELSINAAGAIVGRSVDSEDDRRLVTEVVSGVRGN